MVKDIGVKQCKECDLHEKYTLEPYIGSESKYLIIGESPVNAKELLTPFTSDF